MSNHTPRAGSCVSITLMYFFREIQLSLTLLVKYMLPFPLAMFVSWYVLMNILIFRWFPQCCTVHLSIQKELLAPINEKEQCSYKIPYSLSVASSNKQVALILTTDLQKKSSFNISGLN